MPLREAWNSRVKGQETIGRPCRRANRHLRRIRRPRTQNNITSHAPTNKQHQSLRRWLNALNPILPHPADYGANEVNVEDGPGVDEVEDHGNGQEAKATEPSHGGRGKGATRLIKREMAVRAFAEGAEVKEKRG